MTKNQARLLRFAIQYKGWHTYGNDRSTINTLRTLENHGLIEIKGLKQFRLKENTDE